MRRYLLWSKCHFKVKIASRWIIDLMKGRVVNLVLTCFICTALSLRNHQTSWQQPAHTGARDAKSPLPQSGDHPEGFGRRAACHRWIPAAEANYSTWPLQLVASEVKAWQLEWLTLNFQCKIFYIKKKKKNVFIRSSGCSLGLAG